jgi:DMSO/TMAO reductase YedYZ molybdopterin-dependent catalytic subunit
MPDHRRDFLVRSATLSASAWLAPSVLAAQEARTASSPASGMIVRSRRPLDLETPVDRLDSELTPNDWFYVRNHFGEPAVNPAGWKIAFEGEFGKKPTMSLPEIFAKYPRYELPAVAMCAGNGRALFRPRVAGLPWERGAVGQAVWSGVRMADVIRDLAATDSAKHLIFETADVPPSPMTPPYTRSLPIDRLLQEDVLLADRMNGEPLPLLHGGPVRLVVPTWTANHWVKWIVRVTASPEESPAFFQRTGYKMPTVALPPSEAPKPDQLVSVTTLNVKSLVTSHIPGQKLGVGRHEIRGQAWTGPGMITSVEVRARPDDPWSLAELTTAEPRQGAWVRWRWLLETKGREMLSIETRATDSKGVSQPVEPLWNRSGYLYNAIDGVPLEIV